MKTEQDTYGFMELYFQGTTEEPFASAAEQWSAWERFVDMLCMISLVMKEQKRPESLGRIGCLLEDEALVKTLEPGERAAFPCRKQVRDIFELLLRKGRGPEGAGASLPLSGFLSENLEPVEMMAFLLAACGDRSRKYERIFGVLQEERSGTAKPTAGLVHDLCGLFLEEAQNMPGLLLDEDRFLNRFLLQPQRDDARLSRLSRPISLRKPVVSLLYGNRKMLGGMAYCAQVLEEGDTDLVLCHQEALERLIQVFVRMTVLREDGVVLLQGNPGTGKRYLAQALGDSLGMEALCIHGRKLLSKGPEAVAQALEEAVLKTVLAGHILYLDMNGVGREEAGPLAQALVFLKDYVGRFLIGADASWREETEILGHVYRIAVEKPGAREQKAFWEHFAGEYGIGFAEDVDLNQLVSLYDLTPGRIRETLACAMLAAPMAGDAFLLGKRGLEEEIRHQCSGSLGRYAARLDSPFGWEDLQLSGESRKQLEHACDRIRFRSVVNEEYGFGRKLPYGRGLSILLYGPPGTGKTMTAQVLANELGLDIYRIDLSQIGSKYIGETEKNLGAVFDAARFSNAILFFDEADALFTKRTEVASSNDRHANAETAYLLQRIEEYSGVSILATNVMQNFDNAFKRRMTFLIPIEQPGEEERLALWEKVFPEEAPLEKGIDFGVYARVAELTGSGIKSAALTAAYRAAAEHRRIGNQDLIGAVDLEYRRIGRTGINQELYTALYMEMGRGGSHA